MMVIGEVNDKDAFVFKKKERQEDRQLIKKSSVGVNLDVDRMLSALSVVVV